MQTQGREALWPLRRARRPDAGAGKCREADGIIFGSPVYFHNITGMMRSFLERLLFPCIAYDRDYSSLALKNRPRPASTP